MSLDFNTVKLLLWSKNLGASFDRTLTLGHQGLSCSPRQLKGALRDFGLPATEKQLDACFEHEPCRNAYADQFLRLLGCSEMVAVDRSDFEGANLLHDLNEPFPQRYRSYFDFLVDGGTLEHIFNYPAALRNCMETIRVGGHFLTATPANHVMGHGFYQFSPELFFRVFSTDNGFRLRKIVLYDTSTADADFFEIFDPAITGLRTELASCRPMYIGALAQRTSEVSIFSSPPQQSDYFAAWERHRQAPLVSTSNASGLRSRLRLAADPYLPVWLKRTKNAIAFRLRQGAPKLSNKRQFRRLERTEIYTERQRTG